VHESLPIAGASPWFRVVTRIEGKLLLRGWLQRFGDILEGGFGAVGNWVD